MPPPTFTAKNNTKRGANRRVSQNKSPNKGHKNPPQLSTEIVGTKTFRFRYEKDEIQTVNLFDQDLLNLLSVVYSPYTFRVFESVKLKSIEMWNCNIQNTAHTISCEWLRTYPYGNKTSIVSDTALGTAVAAHVMAKPPSDSLTASWISAEGAPSAPVALANLVIPKGTIIDITVSFVINTNSPGITSTVTPPALSPGTIFVPVIYGILIPVSVNY